MGSTNKLFNWVHNKFNGKQGNNGPTINYAPSKSNISQTPQLGGQKEEFSDWPQGFLSIGTLFTKSSKEDNTKDDHNNNNINQEKSPISSHNPILDITLEEVKELQKELNTLISSHDLDSLTSLSAENEKISHSSSWSSSSSNYKEGDYYDNNGQENDDQQYTSNIVPNKAKDVYLDRKKSVSFLLKKMFICGVGGLNPSPTPSLRDPTILASKSSISKILRAMLGKKIYPQNSCPTVSRKKCLGNGQVASNDELETEGNDKIKWDKSDTEYIVLEI